MGIESVRITVKTTYIPEKSSASSSSYVYAYTITIANIGTEPTQLISREWIIRDGRNQKREVAGMGVVGEQPRILPGKDYTYTSGVVLETPTGTMEGNYQMKTDAGNLFKVPIPTFALVPPSAIH